MTVTFVEPLISLAVSRDMELTLTGGQLQLSARDGGEEPSGKYLQITRHESFDFGPANLVSRLKKFRDQVFILQRGGISALPALDQDGNVVPGENRPISTSNAMLFGQVLFLSGVVLTMAEKRVQGVSRGATATNREIFYVSLRVCGTEQSTERAAKKLAALLKVPFRALGIEKKPVGKIAGPLIIDCGDGNVIDCTKTVVQPAGYDVPSNLANILFGIETPACAPKLYTPAKLLIVAEAGGISTRFYRDRTWEKYPVVFICTHGNMTDDANVLINIMSRGFEMPVWYIVDGDKGGLVCMNSPYRITSEQRDGDEFEALFSGVHTNLLGIKGQDYETLGIEDVKPEDKEMDDEYVAEIEKWEKESGIYDHGNHAEKRAHVEAIKKHRIKAQCEWVATDKWWEYIEEKLGEITDTKESVEETPPTKKRKVG